MFEIVESLIYDFVDFLPFFLIILLFCGIVGRLGK